MSFWSGETLAIALPRLITPFDKKNIDCAAYKLHVGPEVYISPSSTVQDPASRTKMQLSKGQGFAIPAGQFAFLLTEEHVEVPANAIAFISMRAKIKFKGLVNVSGFHVDPGYKGRLVFSVFNAGPTPVHLAQGDDCFLIWYAGLDKPSAEIKSAPGFDAIPTDLINGIAGEVQSFAGLLEKIQELSDRVHEVEKGQQVGKLVVPILLSAALSLAIALGVRGCSQAAPPSLASPAASGVSAPAAPQLPITPDGPPREPGQAPNSRGPSTKPSTGR